MSYAAGTALLRYPVRSGPRGLPPGFFGLVAASSIVGIHAVGLLPRSASVGVALLLIATVVAQLVGGVARVPDRHGVVGPLMVSTFLTTGVWLAVGGRDLGDAVGVLSFALLLVALYAGLALRYEDARRRTTGSMVRSVVVRQALGDGPFMRVQAVEYAGWRSTGRASDRTGDDEETEWRAR